jgi:NADPH:quinone reductase-like Zn-dependent oxidoreductase
MPSALRIRYSLHTEKAKNDMNMRPTTESAATHHRDAANSSAQREDNVRPPNGKLPHIPAVMSAIAYGRYGDADVLHPAMMPTPRAKQGEVLIRVHTASLNPIDYRIRRGEIKWLLPGGFPRIPGYDVAGRVVEERSNGRFSVGDRVFAFLENHLGGGYAEYAVCSANSCARMSEKMSYEEAAAIPLAGTTAIQSLRDHGKITPECRVLINGASGGVGAFAVQIAKSYHAHVTGIASASNRQFVQELGADEFIDYAETDFTTMSRTWDLIFDAAGKSSYLAARTALSSEGRYVSTEPSVKGALFSLATKLLSKRGRVMLAKPRASDLEKLALLYDSGQFKVTVSDVFDLDDAAKAQRLLESGVERGKIVLRVGKEVGKE